MKILLELNEETNYTKLSIEEGEATLDTIVAILLSGLDAVLSSSLDGADSDTRLDMYESTCALFDKLLERVFPDIEADTMDFSDAAVLYAQDLIIERAEKEGKSYDEVMKAFEKEAKEYIENKRRSLS